MQSYEQQKKIKSGKVSIARTIVIAIITIFFSVVPFGHNFMSDDIEYTKGTIEDVALVKGENKIGDIIIEYDGNQVTSVKNHDREIVYFIGFNNAQQFFLVGAPYFSLLFVTIFLGIILTHIKESKLRTIGFCVFFFYSFTAVYYTMWTLFVLEDFSDWAYYGTLIVSSLFITCMMIFYFRYRKSMSAKISELVHYILHTRSKTIKPLAEEAFKHNSKQTETIIAENEEKLNQTLSKIL
ncbi:hypothetical protein UJ101_01208 [Flavobacteriaceae bacterium UJ101]|nr:hypothetical protein UJ101_01208 [Flavobacteriaceae bacterium UJ101]